MEYWKRIIGKTLNLIFSNSLFHFFILFNPSFLLFFVLTFLLYILSRDSFDSFFSFLFNPSFLLFFVLTFLLYIHSRDSFDSFFSFLFLTLFSPFSSIHISFLSALTLISSFLLFYPISFPPQFIFLSYFSCYLKLFVL